MYIISFCLYHVYHCLNFNIFKQNFKRALVAAMAHRRNLKGDLRREVGSWIHSHNVNHVAFLGQARSPQPPGKKQTFVFGMPTIGVTQNNHKMGIRRQNTIIFFFMARRSHAIGS